MRRVATGVMILILAVLAGSSLLAATEDVKCQNCGFENPEDNRFCNRCGERLARDMSFHLGERPVAKILEVQRQRVMLDSGEQGGLLVGQFLQIKNVDEYIINSDTGDTLGVKASLASRLRVTEVLKQIAYAEYQIVSGAGPEVDDLVFLLNHEPTIRTVGITVDFGDLSHAIESNLLVEPGSSDDGVGEAGVIRFAIDGEVMPRIRVGAEYVHATNPHTPWYSHLVDPDEPYMYGHNTLYGVYGKFAVVDTRIFDFWFKGGFGRSSVETGYDGVTNGSTIRDDKLTKDSNYWLLGGEAVFTIGNRFEIGLGFDHVTVLDDAAEFELRIQNNGVFGTELAGPIEVPTSFEMVYLCMRVDLVRFTSW